MGVSSAPVEQTGLEAGAGTRQGDQSGGAINRPRNKQDLPDTPLLPKFPALICRSGSLPNSTQGPSLIPRLEDNLPSLHARHSPTSQPHPTPRPRVAHFLVPEALPVDDVVPLAGPPLGPGPSDPTYAHLAEAPAPHRQPAPTGVISGHHHSSDPHHVPGGGWEDRDNSQ